mmetsp:Transcript_9009/g.36797  ORF Transcript_9009/g.36797 Transcript_9009/m.36797 type:complete len:226 (+) Transcript_9009:2165-2842(+)
MRRHTRGDDGRDRGLQDSVRGGRGQRRAPHRSGVWRGRGRASARARRGRQGGERRAQGGSRGDRRARVRHAEGSVQCREGDRSPARRSCAGQVCVPCRERHGWRHRGHLIRGGRDRGRRREVARQRGRGTVRGARRGRSRCAGQRRWRQGGLRGELRQGRRGGWCQGGRRGGRCRQAVRRRRRRQTQCGAGWRQGCLEAFRGARGCRGRHQRGACVRFVLARLWS